MPQGGGLTETSEEVKELAGELGLEPRMTVPKTAVLPLHHSPAGTAQGPTGPAREGAEIAQDPHACNVRRGALACEPRTPPL